MANLKDIRKRIQSVKNTQKITQALKLVSAAKLSRAQSEMNKLRPYAEKLRGLVNELSAGSEAPTPLFEVRPERRRVAALVLTSDRGMCGAFNSALLKRFARYAATEQAQGVEVVAFPLGRRAMSFVRKGDYQLGEALGQIVAPDTLERLPSIARQLVGGFEEGEFDEVVIFVNRFKNAITQEPERQRFLPISLDEEAAGEAEGQSVDRLYEPSREALLSAIVPQALETQLRQAILESIAGEHAARMNAMSNATDNASDMIRSLTLTLNRARQAAITKELMEIISGSEALK